MKLYNLKRGDTFLLLEDPVVPVGHTDDVNWLTPYKLKNIDGMYSYVTDKSGNVYHFAAWTEVNPIENN